MAVVKFGLSSIYFTYRNQAIEQNFELTRRGNMGNSHYEILEKYAMSTIVIFDLF